jgi:uncharacterized protein involved in exopolysaccharide biosynthesis
MERYSITDLIRLGLRRFFWMFIPFLLLLILGFVALGLVPARYHSKALLVVQDQQVSPDLVPSAVRAIAEDRLETIKAELRSRNNVVRLSETFGLIDRTSNEPFSRKVGSVRDDIRISINRISNTRRRDEASTITFEIGYVHENPDTAYRVANRLVSDFMEENVEARIEAAEGTTSFLRSEERDVRRQLSDIQKQIADVRLNNPGMTPDSANFNQNVVTRLTAEIERAEARIDAGQQELSLLRMQQPLIIDANERSDAERVALRDLKRRLDTMRRSYTESHPDVIAVTDEVLGLEARLDPASFRRRASEILDYIDGRLAEEDSLSPREMANLEDRRARIEDQMSNLNRDGGELSLARLQFQTNERALLDRIEDSQARLEELRTELAEAENRLRRMPPIAAQLDSLKAEEERLQNFLSRTQANRAQAERSQSLESQQKSERVLILDPPVRPDVPTSPDKPKLAIMLTGAAGGIAAVLGFGPIFLFPKVDTKRQLSTALAGIPVIEVPEVLDAEEQKFRRTVFLLLCAASVLLTGLLGFVVYKVFF